MPTKSQLEILNIDLHYGSRNKLALMGCVLFQYICESKLRFAHGFSFSCFDITKVPIRTITDWIKIQSNGFCLQDCNMTPAILKSILDTLLENA